MTTNAQDRNPKRRRVRRQRLGVLACLLSLMVVMFGHIEAPDATPLDAVSAVVI